MALRWNYDDWRHHFGQAVVDAVEAYGKLPAGLKEGEASLLEELCRILAALGPEGLATEVSRRVFSQRTLGDSKRLEAIQSRRVRLLREFYPLSLPESDKEALAELGMVENPQQVLLAGPVVLDELDVALTAADIGLPASFIERCQVTGLGADRVITVENLTSFHQVVAALPPRTLAVYLGGYHNQVRRHLLVKLAAAGVREFRHWGDIDLGGFRIFVHLRERTGIPLSPLLMDEATYRRHAAQGMRFGEAYGRELAGLLGDGRFEVFWPVVRVMLAEGRRVEQEAVEFVLTSPG